MSAAMELHVALSLRLDATEAYRLAHAYRDEVLAKDQTEPVVVSRFDVAMEPALEEEPVLTIGAIAEDGRPVALRLDEETRHKVAGWLAPTAADSQAYDGELAMLRGLVRTLRTVVREDTVDVGEVRRMLHHHAADDAQARAEAKPEAPDFFQPGHTYAYDATGFTAPELLTVFRVVANTTHPDTGKRMAFGWLRTAEDVAWSPYAEPADEWPACWTDVTEGGATDA